MNQVKKQHFVPRFYLENFTNEAGKIFSFDIQTSHVFETTAENIAHKKFFYDFQPLDKLSGDQTIEKALAHFESESSKVIAKTIALLHTGNLKDLSHSDKQLIAEYIIIQQSRTVESRVEGEHLAKELERQLLSKGVSTEFLIESGLESSKYDAKQHQLYSFLSSDMDERINELSNRTWIFWQNQTTHGFYSSDHPVVGHIHENINPSAYEMYFPLTSRFAISLLLKREFPEWVDQNNKIVIIDNVENVKFYNSLILSNCNRQIYSAENDFHLAVDFLKQNPRMSDPNRQRIAEM